MNTTNPISFALNQHDLAVVEVHRNLPPSALYEHAIRHEKDASIAENGALVAYQGVSPHPRLSLVLAYRGVLSIELFDSLDIASRNDGGDEL